MFILGRSLLGLAQFHGNLAHQRGRLDLVDTVHSAKILQPTEDCSDARGPSLATAGNVRILITGFAAIAVLCAVYVVFQQQWPFLFCNFLCLMLTLSHPLIAVFCTVKDIVLQKKDSTIVYKIK